MFNQYPYLNLNDLNLDYILKAIKEMRYEVTNFVSINAIKYADPIQWNIRSQYEKNTIVIDPQTGTAYISVAPVPAGVALTRPEYWTVVFDLGRFVTRAAKNFTTRYEQETTLTATFPTTAGEWLVWGDTLYVANTNITAGDSYVVDGNIRRITVEEVKNTIMQLITNNYDAIIAMIGNLDDLTTTAKNNIVAAINELVSGLSDEVQARRDNINAEVQARQNADTALSAKIDDEVQARTDADGALSNRINNEVQARKDADDNLRDYIDSQISTVDSIAGFSEQYANKSILIIGDSLSYDTGASWSTKFKTMAESIGCTVNNISQSGADTVAALTALNKVTGSYDVAILWIGINDIGLSRPIGHVLTSDTFLYNYNAIIEKLRTINNSMKIFAFSISHSQSFEYDAQYSPFIYSAAIRGMCVPRGIAFKDISAMQNASAFNRTAQYDDGTHFLPEYSQGSLYYTIVNKMLTANSDAYDYSITVNSNCFTLPSGVVSSDITGLYTTDGKFSLRVVLQTSATINAGDPLATLKDTFKPSDRTRILLVTGGNSVIGGYVDINGVITAGIALTEGFYTVFADVVPASAGVATFLS